MGGRGGASHIAAGGGNANTDAGPFKSADRIAKRMGITLNIADLKLGQIQPKYVVETLNAVKAVYKAFPAMKGRVKYIDANVSNPDAYASAGGDGGLHMGLYGRWSQERLDLQWAHDIAVKWHPAGTTAASIFVHEMGHQIESYLNARDYRDEWAWGKSADKIVFEAVKKLDSTIEKLRSPEAYAYAKSISDYAAYKYNEATGHWATWETLAEATADYYCNGEKANPLSQEIWKILQREMKK